MLNTSLALVVHILNTYPERLMSVDFPHNKRWLGGSALAISIALSMQIAHAQTTSGTTAPPPPPAVSPTASLVPVVITARHRAERVQSVPVPITVIDANQIKTVGSSNLNKLQQLVPSLTVASFNPRNTSLTIRGLGSVPNLANDGLEGGVGTYVDGVLLARPAQNVFDFPDIQDIEVLRGPQGTLFGKNTVAGAINITTRLPSFTPEVDGSISYGTQNYVQLKASASSALFGSDKLAFRLSIQGTQHDGYIKNITNDETYSNQNDKGVRAQILYDATPDLTIRAIFDYSHQHENCCVNLPDGFVTNFANGAPLPTAENAQYLYQHLFNYAVPTTNPFKRITDVDSPVYYDMETGGGSIQADYNLHGFTLTSISAVRYWNWYPHNDLDSTGLPLLTASNTTDYQRQVSQELRVVSPIGGPVDYTGGLYYFYQSINDQSLETLGSDAAAILTGTTSGLTYNAYNYAVNGFSQDSNGVYDTNSLASYGQATWHVLPKLDITGGLRYTYEAKTGSFDQVQQGGTSLSEIPAPYRSAVTAIRNGFSPVTSYNVSTYNSMPAGLLTVSYKPIQNILTYVTYSHGAKSAGINLVSSPTVPKVVAPETIDNYEIGFKSTLLDDRLFFDADAFWEENKNYQGTLIGNSGNSEFTYISNIPKVRSRGVEVDSRAQPTPNLNLFFSGIYDNAYYESNPSAPCPIELANTGTSCNLTGRPLVGVSTWTGSFGGEYDYPLPHFGSREVIAYAGGNVLLKSGFYSGADDSKYSFIPGYGIGNIDFGFKSANGAWDLSGWIHNVTDSHYYLYRGASGNGSFPTYNLIIAQVGDPISGGVTLSGKF
jgi:iron complex outermembrane receptor protein